MDIESLKSTIEGLWKDSGPKPFDPKNPVVKLHEATYGAEEILEFVRCLLGTEVTMGPKVRRFEGEFCSKFGTGHAAMVNSGSSANLLAISAVSNPAVEGHLKPGDEVIVPALCWSTTVWPLIQHQLVPVVVDADPKTLNIDVNEVERAIGPKTRAVMPVHIYGNPCDMDALCSVIRNRGLTLIEDSCESLGAFYDGKPVGSFGRVGTFSFYYSHHITTLEGGMAVTSDDALAETLRVLRAHGWVREMKDSKKPIEDNPSIDPKFLFVNLGYNLRATEPQGAMGSVQLRKLDGFVDVRRDNAAFWKKDLAEFAGFFEFQDETPKGRHSWFGFPMRVRPGGPFGARDLMAFMRGRGVEMRPLNAGNIARQPALARFPHRVAGDLHHADDIMKNGFTWGNHQHVGDAARRHVSGAVRDFIRSIG